MKRNILCAVIGSIVGRIAFYPLTMPISLTIMLNMGVDSTESLKTVSMLSWLIPLVGAITGGLFGGYIGKNKPSLALFKNTTISIVFWSIASFGLLGLDIGAWFSGVTLIGLGNTSTAIDLWIFSGIVMIVGVIAGAVIGVLIALIRLTINKLYAFSSQAQ